MCGILAVFSKTGPLEPAPCRRALSAMHWRGPDFSVSRLWEDRLFIGQTVLSITGDPRRGKEEYQRSYSGRYDLLFNGQIYNFRALASQFLQRRPELAPRYGTDTEVLTNLHEIFAPQEVPAHLDGMYAYVLFDRQARQLHLARDVQGEKSLYLYEDARILIVASEIQPIRILLPHLGIDPQAIRNYFRTRHLMLLGRTVYEGIHELAPGQFDTLDLDSHQWTRRRPVSLRDWIDPQAMEANTRRSTDSLVDELDDLFARCVIEMIPRDRRYAAVVSGGVDSSLVASYLVRHGNPNLLVAVNHRGKDRLSADLTGFEKVLNHPIHVLQVDAASYAAEISQCQYACGSPLPSHSFVPQSQQCALVRTTGCRVLFGGEGADEWFGGYDAYLNVREFGGRFSPSPYTAHLRPMVQFRSDAPEPFLADLAAAWSDALDAYRFVRDKRTRVRLAMMYCDGAYQLPAVGLRAADLMAMMWSVETRSLYLRRPIIKFALNLPVAMKANADEHNAPLLRAKPLLKRLFLRRFPSHLLAEKQGFGGFPNESAVCLGEPADFRVLDDLQIDPDSVAAAWNDQATAWKLINAEYFLRQNRGSERLLASG